LTSQISAKVCVSEKKRLLAVFYATFAPLNLLSVRRLIYALVLLAGWALAAQSVNGVEGFIENKGQIVDEHGAPNPAVKYLLNTPGLNVQLKQSGFAYDVYLSEKNTAPRSQKLRFHRVDVAFENANPLVEIIGLEKSADYDNYYTVASATQGILNVHAYKKVLYRNIYEHVDVIFFIPSDTSKPVEYNFIIRPGGRIGDIRMKFSGAATRLSKNKIRMQLRFGDMEETLPLSWTEDASGKERIGITYKKLGADVYGFRSDRQTHGQTLVIDPVPVRLWGTYYAGNNGDFSSDICNDQFNNVYFSGYTYSTTNIATIGTYPETVYFNGFLAKFNTDGQRQWGIYYGATPESIEVDGAGNVYFTGAAWSEENIATPGSYQPEQADYDDAFLVKINPSGVREWGTYFGGPLMDQGKDIAIDGDGNIYLAGDTSSYTGIATPGAYETVLTLGQTDNDGFLARFTPQGERVWATYYGGNGLEFVSSCHVSGGDVILTGNTHSAEGIGTPGSYQPNLVGYAAGMMAKFDLNGQLIWGSYLNGATGAEIRRSALRGNYLYLTGTTNSQTSLISAGTFNESFIDLFMQFGWSSYVMKFDIQTQTQVWGTYFGERIQDIEVNTNDHVFLGGCTNFTSGIATPDAYKPAPQYSDAYLIKLDQSGQRLWGTYYGGNFMEGTNGAADVNNELSLDTAGNIYLVGNTSSTTGISTPGAHQETHMLNSLGGLYNIYVAKLQDCLTAPLIAGTPSVCIGGTITLSATNGTNYSWTGPNGFSSSLPNPNIPNALPIHSGIYSCTVTGTGGCDGTVSLNVTVGDMDKPIPDQAALPAIGGDCHTVISTIPTATDLCAGAVIATTADPLAYSAPGTYTIHWQYDDGNGNVETQLQTVNIAGNPLPVAPPVQTFCIQQNATLSEIDITGNNIIWYDAAVGGNVLAASEPLQDGATYFASQTINGCESVRGAVQIAIQHTSPPDASPAQTFCSSQNPTVADLAAAGTQVYWYDDPTGPIALLPDTPLTDGEIYYGAQTVSGCQSPVRTAVSVAVIGSLNAHDYSGIVCDNLNDAAEQVDLTAFEDQFVADASNCTFNYYTSEDGAENQLASAAVTSPLNATVASNSTFYVRITSADGCLQIVKLELSLVATPVIGIPEIVALCEGRSVTLDAGSGFDSYAWSTGSTSQVETFSMPGNYHVSVNDIHGQTTCTTIKNFSVALSNAATITGINTGDWTENDNMIAVDVEGMGDYLYSLDGIGYQESNVFTHLSSGIYTVYVKDRNGCGIVTDEVLLLMYPKFFTPNADGFNDTWSIKFSYFEPGLKVWIFDRYGKLLTAIDHGGSWDGTLNGQPLPSTDYWFLVTRAGGKQHRGHFTLKR
jgi:gliding motility-associated-like protein